MNNTEIATTSPVHLMQVTSSDAKQIGHITADGQVVVDMTPEELEEVIAGHQLRPLKSHSTIRQGHSDTSRQAAR